MIKVIEWIMSGKRQSSNRKRSGGNDNALSSAVSLSEIERMAVEFQRLIEEGNKLHQRARSFINKAKMKQALERIVNAD